MNGGSDHCYYSGGGRLERGGLNHIYPTTAEKVKEENFSKGLMYHQAYFFFVDRVMKPAWSRKAGEDSHPHKGALLIKSQFTCQQLEYTMIFKASQCFASVIFYLLYSISTFSSISSSSQKLNQFLKLNSLFIHRALKIRPQQSIM